ncbi:MAG: translation initiation factor IF-5A [Candidatus Aenigmatarchaeota archaeon]
MPKERKKVKNLREGNYVLIDDKICKIMDITTSAPGKHGHKQYRIKGRDIINGKKYEFVESSDGDVDVPIIDKRTGQVLSVSSNSVQLMDMESYETFEVAAEDDMKSDLSEGEEVSYWEVMGKKILRPQ